MMSVRSHLPSMFRLLILSGLALAITACGGGGGSDDGGVSTGNTPVPTATPVATTTVSPTPTPAISPAPTPDSSDMPFLRVSGKNVVDTDGEPVWLKGISFGNEVWQNTEIPSAHHNEDDYAYVADMGMNVVRFYFHYRTFEDDNAPYTYKQSGWDWIDQNIEWAKKHGIYLILNAHVPQGGFQSGGEGDALWEVEDNQNRLVALYEAMAERYKNESTILGYDLVNEPFPTENRAQWESLAQRLVDAIRTVDDNHIIVVERTHNVENPDFSEPTSDNNMFLVNDDNIVYTFHFYEPGEYTHQFADWIGLGEGGKYPDDNRLVDWTYAWITAAFDTPAISRNFTGWQYYEGTRYKVENPDIDFLAVALINGTNTGRTYFDDVVVKEYDETGAYVRDAAVLTLDSLGAHTFYSANDSGEYGVSPDGFNGNAVFMEGTTADANVTLMSHVVDVKPGYSYEATGWMRTQNPGESALAQIRLDLFRYTQADEQVHVRNKAFLESRIDNLISFGERNQVPMYLGEFGLIRHAYEDGRGGLNYSADMVDILKTRDVHFTYHAYNEYLFGLRDGENINQELVNIFADKLADDYVPTPTPTPTSSATVTIDPVDLVDTAFTSVSGNSQGIVGDLSVDINNKRYQVTPEDDGTWQLNLDQCSDELGSATYVVQVSGEASNAETVTAVESFAVELPIYSGSQVTIRYYRANMRYEGWGLHLWNTEGNEAYTEDTLTEWTEARPFDCFDNDWAVFRVPVMALDVQVNFIVHRGNTKSPDADLSLTIEEFGSQVWVVQNDTTLYNSESATLGSIESLGNASINLDLSTVDVGDTSSALPSGWNRRANFMEIYVRGYQDSDGDGVGDIQGLISRLPYLKDLGVEGLWLMPVTESSDNNHGYLVTDYRDIEDDYGTMDDFQQLISAAHAQGIGIVIDYVVNHSSDSNPLFVDANITTDNDKRDWYIFRDSDPQWGAFNDESWHEGDNGGVYYGAFGGPLPDFNLANPEVEAFHFNNLRFWLNMGVDGFRLDAVGVLFEGDSTEEAQNNAANYPFLKRLLDVVNSYDNRYLVCEAPYNPASYAGPDVCGNSFAFDTQWQILDSARDQFLRSEFLNQLRSSEHQYMPLFLSNHDRFAGGRPMSYFLGCGDSCQHIQPENVEGYLKLAATMYLLTSNTPFVYYGEEVGVSGAQGDNDEVLRPPMSWLDDAVTAGFTSGVPFRSPADNILDYNVLNQDGVDESLLSHYKTLLNLRKQNRVLADGTLEIQSFSGARDLTFIRDNGNEKAAILINLTTETRSILVDTGDMFTNYLDVYSGRPAQNTGSSGMFFIDVEAQSAAIFMREFSPN